MKTELVSVVGTELITAINEQGMVFIAMKPLIEAMGLNWKSQSVKLNKDSRYGVIAIPYETASGVQEMVSLNADHLPAFLYSINPNKVKKELRDKIIAFQNETFAVINSYWRGKQKHNPDLEKIIMAQNATIANQQRQLESKPKQIENKNPMQTKAFKDLMIETEKELKQTATQDRHWYENRADYWIRVVQYIQKHGTDGQKAAAELKEVEGKYNKLRVKFQNIQSFIHEAYEEST